ncbi:esterase family protein [Mycobacterium hodleri]|uniref:alpha/beta hydrolase-fold protein n=1 Tax=Mycolicibacterium hodleri TaxID=49897 RepID=UPI0021F33A43|nr:alpha/beta hydrolase-fold protein [Mycolicibacterium hodleri]MCV7131873.1 esterase family protein [Mycolicibacterium hodleri]
MVTAGLAVAVGLWRHDMGRLSLMHGWVPVAVQILSVTMLVGALAGRSRRWLRWAPPLAVAVGAALGVWGHWFIASAGFAGDPAPAMLWLWMGLSGSAAAAMFLGWRGARWGRRWVSTLAVPLCVLSAGLIVNGWVGYFPTVHSVYDQLTAAPLPHQTDRATVTAMQLAGVVPAHGVVVPVAIGSQASGFTHRQELVYLPPAWFASTPPPRLPVVMMIGGEFNTPSDWVRAGDAVSTADRFAAGHGGYAPVLVLVDSGGAFNVDTECVNGSRGNAADHLTKDVVPFMISNFGVSPDRSNWGVAGFSTGGTCAVDLAVMHPELFSTFADIAGDVGPNSGTKAQTIARLFGGSADAWARFDPVTVITRHGPYQGLSGSFSVVSGQDGAATALCALARANGIACSVTSVPGRHDWPFAGRAFAEVLPWLAGQLDTPQALPVPLPGTAPSQSASVGVASAARAG